VANRDAVSGLAGLDRQGGGEVRLAGAGGPKKQTLLCSVIQASWERCRISGFSAPGWALKSKSSKVLWAGKAAWRMRCRAPEASRAKTSASSSASRNYSYGQPSSRARVAVCSMRSSTRGALSFASRYGERDEVLPDVAEAMARVQRDLPRAEATALPCGHFLQEEAPQEVGEPLGSFFAEARHPDP
jgi:pimeloyl-ACP methyl ester carboxylesterase